MYIGSIFFTFFVLLLIAALVLVLNPLRKAVLNESCAITQCSSELNLKCIDGICKCYSTEDYKDKCTGLSTHLEPCFTTSNCWKTLGLTCQSKKCKCLSTYFWNGTSCTPRYSYTIKCSGDQCLTNLGLSCDSSSGTCLCPSTDLLV